MWCYKKRALNQIQGSLFGLYPVFKLFFTEKKNPLHNYSINLKQEIHCTQISDVITDALPWQNNKVYRLPLLLNKSMSLKFCSH